MMSSLDVEPRSFDGENTPALALADTWAAVISIGPTYAITLFNAEAERLTGYRADDALGRHVCDVLGLECHINEAGCRWRRVVVGDERRLQPRETPLHPRGRRVDVLLGARPSQDTDGSLGAVLTFIDLTYHRNVEQIRTALMADVFHELRSPVCAISMAAHFLDADFEQLPPDRIRSLLDTIQRNASTLLTDLNDLLNRSTFTDDAPTVTSRALDLDGVIEQAAWKLRPLLEERDQRVCVNLGALPLLWADERRVEQVLVNLLANANKYSVAGDEIVVGAAVQGAMVRVYVEDHGPGLSPADKARVFDRFYRSAKTADTVTGAGLGLSIMRRIVEAHGGRVGVETSTPHGARFWFTLPIAR